MQTLAQQDHLIAGGAGVAGEAAEQTYRFKFGQHSVQTRVEVGRHLFGRQQSEQRDRPARVGLGQPCFPAVENVGDRQPRRRSADARRLTQGCSGAQGIDHRRQHPELIRAQRVAFRRNLGDAAQGQRIQQRKFHIFQAQRALEHDFLRCDRYLESGSEPRRVDPQVLPQPLVVAISDDHTQTESRIQQRRHQGLPGAIHAFECGDQSVAVGGPGRR